MALSKDDILEAIANMSVMEVVDLISAMEEKFGVSAAPVSVLRKPKTWSKVFLQPSKKASARPKPKTSRSSWSRLVPPSISSN